MNSKADPASLDALRARANEWTKPLVLVDKEDVLKMQSVIRELSDAIASLEAERAGGREARECLLSLERDIVPSTPDSDRALRCAGDIAAAIHERGGK
jgi:hypothetical protein